MIQNAALAMTGGAQLVECRPAKQKVDGSIPSQGTGLCAGQVPGQEAYGRQPIVVSLTH